MEKKQEKKASERRSHTISHLGYSNLIKLDRCWRKSLTVWL